MLTNSLIKTYGTILGCIKRESDWVSRFGGEEFLICLPGAGNKKSADIVENMRTELEPKVIVSGNNKFKITASLELTP